jgi:hypothetical protein
MVNAGLNLGVGVNGDGEDGADASLVNPSSDVKRAAYRPPFREYHMFG